MEIITAEQAREFMTEASQKTLESLLSDIRKIAGNGGSCAFTRNFLKDEHINKLRELGYELEFRDAGIVVRW